MTTHIASQQRRTPKNEWIESAKTAGLGLLMAVGVHTFIAEVRYIPSGSMSPTLHEGDRVIVEKLSYHIRSPQRGEVVVFQAPPELKVQNLDGDYIKRIVGLPGDRVQVQGGQVFVNGQALSETYLQALPNYAYGPVTVPQTHYFVLGDNRNQSYDSHLWGFVPRDAIVGHASLHLSLSRFGLL
jgi:signal peptidase I